jgi:type I restriction enzyme S subunit
MKYLPFYEALEDCSRLAGKVPQASCLHEGDFPVIGQGKQFVEGFTNDSDLVFRGGLPVILFGDHTAAFKFIDRPFARGADGTKLFRPRTENLDAKFVWHFLQTARLPMTGYDRKTKYLESLEIPLPPLEEQRRIAAILDKANDIQGRQQEASNTIQAVPTSLFLTLFGDPRVNSRSWPEHSLGELGRVVTGATPPSSEQGMFDGPVPFITPGDLGSGKEAKRSLSESGSLRSRTVKRGSALVCCIGATIGKMDIAKRDSAFNQQINAVEWGDSIIGEYGIEALRFFSRNIAKAGASTTLPILKKSSFEKLRLPVPPVELQHEYGRQLEAIYAHSGSLHQALQIAASLKQSLMSRAFIGEL